MPTAADPKTEPKTFTARLPRDLYEASTRVAEKRRMSMNALLQEALRSIVEEEEEKAFYDSFTLLGQDSTLSDVEYALSAQAEVVNA